MTEQDNEIEKSITEKTNLFLKNHLFQKIIRFKISFDIYMDRKRFKNYFHAEIGFIIFLFFNFD